MPDDGVIPRSPRLVVDMPTPFREQVRQQVIEVLEEALLNAKAGRIAAIGVAIVETSGATATVATAAEPMSQLIGATAILHHRVTHNHAYDGPHKSWFEPVGPDDAS